VTPVTVNAADRFYNLEEMEDKDTCTTEVFLTADGGVSVGETDGPLFVGAKGSWSQQGETFRMSLTRTYDAGAEKTNPTDVGEFTFDTERIFTGTLTIIGEKVAVEGSVHMVDEHGDNEVGFFSMIDTTKERLGEEDEE
jgi:hypothetical protein